MEEFKKGHVDVGSDKILNIPYMFNTPEGNLNLLTIICRFALLFENCLGTFDTIPLQIGLAVDNHFKTRFEKSQLSV